jgi:hypothetical protein
VANLHPFDLAVLNRQLAARGYAPAPGNAQWFEPAPEPAPEKEEER